MDRSSANTDAKISYRIRAIISSRISRVPDCLVTWHVRIDCRILALNGDERDGVRNLFCFLGFVVVIELFILSLPRFDTKNLIGFGFGILFTTHLYMKLERLSAVLNDNRQRENRIHIWLYRSAEERFYKVTQLQRPCLIAAQRHRKSVL